MAAQLSTTTARWQGKVMLEGLERGQRELHIRIRNASSCYCVQEVYDGHTDCIARCVRPIRGRRSRRKRSQDRRPAVRGRVCRSAPQPGRCAVRCRIRRNGVRDGKRRDAVPFMEGYCDGRASGVSKERQPATQLLSEESCDAN